MEGKLGKLNQKLSEAKTDGKHMRKILFQINKEKAALIRDKSNLDTINTIGGMSIVSFISTDYSRINGMSDMITKLAKSMSNGEPDYQNQLESEGYVGLTKATTKWDESADNNTAKWSTFVYPFIKNEMINYTRRNERWSKMEYRDDIDVSAVAHQETQEVLLLHKEKLLLAYAVLAGVVQDSNERESYILWNNILADEPESYRSIADLFQCSKDSIMRDVQRLSIKLGKEIKI